MVPQVGFGRSLILALIAVQDPGGSVPAVNGGDVLREGLAARRLERARRTIILLLVFRV